MGYLFIKIKSDVIYIGQRNSKCNPPPNIFLATLLNIG